MKAVKKFWKSTPSEYKDYLFIYLWGVIWGGLFLVQPRIIGPEADIAAWSTSAGRLWAVISITGGVLAILGLVRKDNLVLERAGVTLLMVGPLAYAATLLGELIIRTSVYPESTSLSADWRLLTVIVLALWPFLFLNKRHRHLRNRVHLVREIPLNEENESK